MKSENLTKREIQEIIEYCFVRNVQYIRFQNGLVIDWTKTPEAAPNVARFEKRAKRTDFGTCEVCGDKKIESKYGEEPYCWNCWMKKKERNRE